MLKHAAAWQFGSAGLSVASLLAFGHGIHYCVGAPLARLEGQIVIGLLLSRFPDITLDADADALCWQEGTLVHRLYSLPARVGRP